MTINNPQSIVTLAIETATSVCAVAVLEGDHLLTEVSAVTRHRHNEELPAIVDRALQGAGVAVKQIGLVAVSIGPGSFTGLRVGLSFAKGLALGIGAPVVPVGTLDALALNLKTWIDGKNSSLQPDDRLCPLTVARKGECFGRIFTVVDDNVEPLEETFVGDIGEIGRRCTNRTWIGGEGADVLGDVLMESVEDSLFVVRGVTTSASIVGQLGVKCWLNKRDNIKPLHELEPYYLKEFTIRKPK